MNISELNTICETLTGQTLSERNAKKKLGALAMVEAQTIGLWIKAGHAPDNAATELLQIKADIKTLLKL